MRGVRIQLPIYDLLGNCLRQRCGFWFILVPQTYVTWTKIYGLKRSGLYQTTHQGRDSQYTTSRFGGFDFKTVYVTFTCQSQDLKWPTYYTNYPTSYSSSLIVSGTVFLLLTITLQFSNRPFSHVLWCDGKLRQRQFRLNMEFGKH